MSDEIIKPIEESVIPEASVAEEVPVVMPEPPTLTTSNLPLEPNTVDPEPNLITSPSSLEPNLETSHSSLEPNPANSEPLIISPNNEEQIEAKPLSAPEPTSSESVESVPTLVTSNSSPEPNSVGSSAVGTELPNEAVTDVGVGAEPTGEVYRPYSLDPKLNKIIEAFVLSMGRSKENLVLAQKAVKAKMMKKVYRIMDLFKKKKKIKNDDVEKFIHTSDKTATKYLNILRKEGKIKREGTNNKTYYTKL